MALPSARSVGGAAFGAQRVRKREKRTDGRGRIVEDVRFHRIAEVDN
jgi:hypothetical protein